MAADKAPAEKLSLVLRKNIRDDWDGKKGELEIKLEELLGVPWKFDINPNAIWPYVKKPGDFGSDNIGTLIYAYASAIVNNIKRFLDKHGDEGKTEINSVAPAHVITMLAHANVRYCDVEILDGNLRMRFDPESLGSNIDNVGEYLERALNNAPQPADASPLSYASRNSIKNGWDGEIGPILQRAKDLLQNEKLVFEPGFVEISEQLKKAGKNARQDWEGDLGNFARYYFQGLVDTLKREKFGEDDLLREGLEEAAPKGVVKLRIVDKLETKQSSYNEIVIDDGALVIQTTLKEWGVNIERAADKLVDIL